MLAKFNKTFENRTLETPEKQKIADSALQHLDEIELRIQQISSKKGWDLKTSSTVK